jgi:hypothetical protein
VTLVVQMARQNSGYASASPPVFASGATSAATKQMRME